VRDRSRSAAITPVTIPAVRAVMEHRSNPGLVLVDSHLDTAVDVGGETLNHCCPITRAVDAGFPPERIALVGINGWMNPRSELAYCREHGITVIWLEEIWERGVQYAVDKSLSVAGDGTDGLYLRPGRRRARRSVRSRERAYRLPAA